MLLKEERNKKKITQQEVAEVLNISQRTYSAYELGQTEPTIDTLCKLADYYNVSIDYLVGRQLKNDIGYLSEDEKSLLNDYRQLNEINKIKISAELKGFLVAQN